MTASASAKSKTTRKARTGISWADLTVNFQSGCTEKRLPSGKVDPACLHCYAKLQSARMPALMGLVPPKGPRKGTKKNPVPRAAKPPTEAMLRTGRLYEGAAVRKGRIGVWTGVLKWDREVMRAGFKRIQRGDMAFLGSMTDLFHEQADPEMHAALAVELEALREDRAVMLLTKRVGNLLSFQRKYFPNGFPRNVLVGMTASCQEAFDAGWPTLAKVNAHIRFLSVEPMTGPLDIHRALYIGPEGGSEWVGAKSNLLGWVVCGGESGDKAVPTYPDWVRDLEKQCREGGVLFHLKQWGEWRAYSRKDFETAEAWMKEETRLQATKIPMFSWDGISCFYRVGKEAAGRLLDGVLHDARPDWRQA